MKTSALFFDIDGTLLDNRTESIPESTLQALEQARAHGHYLFINTGRTYQSLPEKIKQLNFDGYMCSCGAQIVFRDEFLFEAHLSLERGKQLIKKMYECNILAAIEAVDTIYFPIEETNIAFLEYEKKYYVEHGFGVLADLKNTDIWFDKMFLYTDENSDLKRFVAFASEDMVAIDRGRGNYEVTQKDYSKGTACDFMMKRLGLGLDQIYVFGDSLNDLAMFEFAKHTVAMGEHAKGLEPYTEFITRKIEDDGIEYAMKHYGLI